LQSNHKSLNELRNGKITSQELNELRNGKITSQELLLDEFYNDWCANSRKSIQKPAPNRVIV